MSDNFISLTFYWTGSFHCYKNQRHSEALTVGRHCRSLHSCIQIFLFYSIELIGNLPVHTTCKFHRRPPRERVKIFGSPLWQMPSFGVQFYRLCQRDSEWKSFHNQAFLRTSQRWNLYWFQQWHDKWGLVSALINEVFIISCFPSSFHSRSRVVSLFCLVRWRRFCTS